MRAKRKIKKEKQCQVPGCKKKWVGGWHPKGQMDKRLLVCRQHINDDDCLWELVGVKKPEYFPKAKTEVKSLNHKPKREGKPAWQGILDKWFERGVYPKSNFMNSKRWTYWLSIGGTKPQGDSRSFVKKKSKKKTSMSGKFDKMLQVVMTGDFSKLKTKKKKVKVRRKK